MPVNWARAGQTITVLVPLCIVAALVLKRIKDAPYRAPKPVEQERADVVSLVAYAAQHSPGVSVGDWPDEHAVDAAYDAIEAIRPQVAGQ